jgi:hypothetical protein
MALEPRTVSLEEPPNPELVDMSRRLNWSVLPGKYVRLPFVLRPPFRGRDGNVHSADRIPLRLDSGLGLFLVGLHRCLALSTC